VRLVGQFSVLIGVVDAPGEQSRFYERRKYLDFGDVYRFGACDSPRPKSSQGGSLFNERVRLVSRVVFEILAVITVLTIGWLQKREFSSLADLQGLLSSKILIVVCVWVALMAYMHRGATPVLYGLAEIGVGTAAIFVAII
jgi:hypothetical protein